VPEIVTLEKAVTTPWVKESVSSLGEPETVAPTPGVA